MSITRCGDLIKTVFWDNCLNTILFTNNISTAENLFQILENTRYIYLQIAVKVMTW